MYKVTNNTNSAYDFPLKGGGSDIIAAGKTKVIDLDSDYAVMMADDPSVIIEAHTTQPVKRTTKRNKE